MSGRVVGINSQILSPSGGNVGIGLAIPATEARPIIEQLMRGDSVERGYLGVGIQEIDEQLAESFGLDKNRGELITSVSPGGPADRAGIEPNDVVVTVNGRPVTPDTTLSYLVANLKPRHPRADRASARRPAAHGDGPADAAPVRRGPHPQPERRRGGRPDAGGLDAAAGPGRGGAGVW